LEGRKGLIESVGWMIWMILVEMRENDKVTTPKGNTFRKLAFIDSCQKCTSTILFIRVWHVDF